MTAPLDGVRVLEVAIYAFVPSATAILADWGADVLKVEHPVMGDPGRNTAAWGVPADVHGVSHLWEVANRGKRAIALDIATPEGKDILLQLVDECDVFVTNFLPPARRKLGIEPEDIMARNPRIIYARGRDPGASSRSEVASTPSPTGAGPAPPSA
jgi:crotonobetainyl-CoA:carnitine CoA-transferase CaiB-like acyl-CoA transferase